MKTLLCIAVLASSLVLMVEGLSGGAPPAACATLSPNPTQHLAPPQTGDNPYSIDLSPFFMNGTGYFYVPGQTYTLSINGTGGEQFRGFLIQARQVSDDTNMVGTFAPVGELSQMSTCTPRNVGVTHNSRVEKDTIYFRFTAPMENTGTIRFGFAVVQQRITYWANQRTAEIQEGTAPDNGPGTTPDNGPGTTPDNGSVGLTASVWAIGIALLALIRLF